MEQLGEFYKKNIIPRETLIHEKWNKIKKDLKIIKLNRTCNPEKTIKAEIIIQLKGLKSQFQ